MFSVAVTLISCLLKINTFYISIKAKNKMAVVVVVSKKQRDVSQYFSTVKLHNATFN